MPFFCVQLFYHFTKKGLLIPCFTKKKYIYQAVGEGEGEQKWPAMKARLETLLRENLRHLTHHRQHIDSFDIFTETYAISVIERLGALSVSYQDKQISAELVNIKVLPPTNTPRECFKQSITYHNTIVADVRVKHGDTEEFKTILTEHTIVCIPTMVHSKVCIGQPGDTVPYGSFIIRGKLRYIPMVTRMVHNVPIALVQNGKYVVQVRSMHWDRIHRSTSTLDFITTAASTRDYHVFRVTVKIPFLNTALPLGTVVVLLGGTLDRFVGLLRKFTNAQPQYEKYFSALIECASMLSASEATSYFKGLYRQNVDHENIIRQEILPHVGDNLNDKLVHIACYTSMLLRLREGEIEPDNRDDVDLLRVDTSGVILATMFRMQFQKSMSLASKMIRKSLIDGAECNFASVYSNTRLTRAIFTAMATGKFTKHRIGMTHQLQCTNTYSLLGTLRRISSSCLMAEGKHIESRLLHPSTYGYICAAETPEGESCGLVQSLALTARVLHGQGDFKADLDKILDSCGTLLESDMTAPYLTVIFDGKGNIWNYTSSPRLFFDAVMQLRRRGEISSELTIRWDPKKQLLFLNTEKGRLVRPLAYVTDKNTINSEIFTSNMEQHIKVCLRLEDDLPAYLEISDVSFVGVLAAMSPFFRHNQGPRLVYWIGMMKQMIVSRPRQVNGAVASSYLWHGQRPLVYTKTAQNLDLHRNRDGANVFVVFYPHAYNQEDAIVFNKAAIDRGLFRSHTEREYVFEISGTKTVFANPSERKAEHLKDTRYEHLQSNGLPRVGTVLKGGDIICGRVTFTKDTKKTRGFRKCVDESILMDALEEGFVSSADLIQTEKGHMAKIIVTSVFVPECGDKFSSRHSQKGTIGFLEDQANLPFNEQGMTPDVMMSPLGLTSRMTIGKVLEIITGKMACVSALDTVGCDSQDFYEDANAKLEYIKDTLASHGFQRNGSERFYDGRTGEMITCQVMSGIVFYTKLNHIVKKKIHARATGPVQLLTRQPTEGRRNNGGLRFGQMEAECVMSHASSEIMRERFVAASDRFEIPLCAQCGYIAIANKTISYAYCQVCNKVEHVGYVQIGYTTKLMIQELMATGVSVRLPFNLANPVVPLSART